MLADLGSSRLLRRALVVAVLVEHLLFIVKPLNVLAPVDPWRIGHLLLTGHVPYRDFAFEYPPLAVLPFLIPAVFPHGWGLSVLALEAAAIDAAVIAITRRRSTAAVWSYLLLSLLLFPFLSGGFDAWAMLAILASTLLLADGHGSGWWVAAAGTLLKLSPGAAWTWARRPLRAAIAALGLTLAAGLAPLAIAHRSTDTYLGYSLHRGVQIESVAGSLAWMGAKAVGHHPAVRYRFRAWEIVGADRLALAIAVAAVVAVGLLVVRTGTAGEITVERAVRASLAAVVILTVGFKVFSPQYVTWTAPLACLIGGRELRVFAGAAALTAAAYVIGGSGLSFMGLIAGRNLAMVTLAVLALGPLVRTSPSGATAT